jgi:thiamine-phosphate diphosphorylase
LSKYAKAHELIFIVNDHPDIAKKVDADGVHIGVSGQLPRARRLLGNDKLIGVSASTLKDALVAEKLGADYIGFGPVFKTPIKPGVKPTGIRVLRQVTNRVKIPVFAIGGVCARTIGQVMASGAAGGAVIRYVSGAEHIAGAVRRLLILSRRPG